jgi:hypothetical protein
MLQPAIEVLRYFLYDRSDVFFLMREASINADCVFIKSPLRLSGVQEQKDFFLAKYLVREFVKIDRFEWVRSVFDGRDFFTWAKKPEN